jgi:hypothetical protein
MSSQSGNRRSPRRRLLIIAGLAILVLTVGASLWLTLGRSANPASAATATIAPQNVSHLQKAIDAKTVQAQAQALQPELQAAFIQSGQSMLPAGTSVTIEAPTFQVTDKSTGDHATVNATTSSGSTFRLYLIKEEGTWYLVFTEKVAQ